MDEILNQINKKNVKIIFNYTLINGTHDNRYIEYDNLKSNKYYDCFTLIKDVDDKIKEISWDFFENNEKTVNDSIIPKALKFLIRQRMV